MARPSKTGLDYFPLDVDFFDDDKIQLIEAEYGLKGSMIAIRLLCKIYKEGGYYYQWGGDQCLLLAKSLGAGVVSGLVSEVVVGLVKRSFFDERLFNSFNILTSIGIQKRYIKIVRDSKIKRELILENYILLESSEDLPKNSEDLPKNSEESTQSKVKESKESKEGITADGVGSPPPKGFISDNSEKEKEKSSAKKESNSPPKGEAYVKFLNWCENNAKRVLQMKEPLTEGQFESIKKDFGIVVMQELLQAMHNYEPLLRTSRSTNLTFRKWVRTQNQSKKPAEIGVLSDKNDTLKRFNYEK